jgi:glycine dehydrogenase subunit 1
LDTLWEKRHFFFQRENATSMIGSSSNLCAIGAAVYLSLMGPQGMREIGEGIFQRTKYAIQEISKIKRIQTPIFNVPHFKEFIINFEKIGKTVKEINKILLNKHGIVGGKDLSTDFPELGQSALFCVTEVHTSEDIEKLADSIRQL